MSKAFLKAACQINCPPAIHQQQTNASARKVLVVNPKLQNMNKTVMLTPRPEGLPSYSGKKPILVFGNIPNSTMGTEK